MLGKAGFMTFYQWLIKHYRDVRCPIGDLADDVQHDVGFPKQSMKRREILDYLMSQNACTACIDVFEKAFLNYKSETKN